jgi:hypothetical protein
MDDSMTFYKAISKALELKGEELLSSPKVFRSVLSDLVDPESDEMRVVGVAADTKFLDFFSRAIGSSDQEDLQKAARCAAAYAVKSYMTDEARVLHVAEQIAHGVWNHFHPDVSWLGKSSRSNEETRQKKEKARNASNSGNESNAVKKDAQSRASQGKQAATSPGSASGSGGGSKRGQGAQASGAKTSAKASGQTKATNDKPKKNNTKGQTQKQPKKPPESGGRTWMKVLAIITGLIIAIWALDTAMVEARRIDVTYHLADGKTVEKWVDPDESVGTYEVDAEDLERDHYEFSGWALDEDGTDVVGRSYQSLLAYEDSNTLSLYALWEPSTIKVVYHEGVDSDQEVTNEYIYSDDLAVTMPGDLFSRELNTLTGWKSDDGEYKVDEVVPIDDLLSSKYSDSVDLYAEYSFDTEAAKSKLAVTPDAEWDDTQGEHVCGFVIRNDSNLTLDYWVEFSDDENTIQYFHAVGPGEERFARGYAASYQISHIEESEDEPLGQRISWSEASYSGSTLIINVTNNSDSTVNFLATYVVLRNTLADYRFLTGFSEICGRSGSVEAGATTQVTFIDASPEKIPYRIFLNTY